MRPLPRLSTPRNPRRASPVCSANRDRRWSAGGDHAMTTDTTSPAAGAVETALCLGEDWFDPLEAGVRTRIRSFIEELLEAELEAALGRKRYERGRTPEKEPSAEAARSPVSGHRHGHRERTLMGTFGAVTVWVPRARLAAPEGETKEWRSASIPAYQRQTRRAEALIAGAYLSGTNTRRVRRALAALFGGAVGKDVVSRVWRKVKTDWDAWTRPRPVSGADHPPRPRRHRRAGAARPQGDRNLAACRAGRAPGRAEGAPRGQEHGRGERGSLAGDPGRSRGPWPEDARVRPC